MTGLSRDDEELLDDAARRLVAARMAVPAMMALEMLTPCNLVTATMLHGLQPLLGMVLPAARVAQVAQLLERRETIPDFIRRLDAAEESRRRAARAPR